jgi:hypothetical protein
MEKDEARNGEIWVEKREERHQFVTWRMQSTLLCVLLLVHTFAAGLRRVQHPRGYCYDVELEYHSRPRLRWIKGLSTNLIMVVRNRSHGFSFCRGRHKELRLCIGTQR